MTAPEIDPFTGVPKVNQPESSIRHDESVPPPLPIKSNATTSSAGRAKKPFLPQSPLGYIICASLLIFIGVPSLLYRLGAGAINSAGHASAIEMNRESGAAPDAATTQKAAELGDATAQHNLGAMYARGLGVPKDDANAFRWYRKAAEQGLAPAQLNLAVMYAQGQGVPRDDAKATEWMCKASMQGYEPAQYILGMMYEQGMSVHQDHMNAYFWFNVAASSEGISHEQAIEQRDKVAGLLSPDQLAEAKRRSRVWLAQFKTKQ
jgi:Sel1 repeat